MTDAKKSEKQKDSDAVLDAVKELTTGISKLVEQVGSLDEFIRKQLKAGKF